VPGHIAFVFAMPMESTPLRKALSLRRDRGGASDRWSGTLDGHPVTAVVTGMGTALATEGVERLLDAVEVDRVVVVGITGAVDDDTPLGTVVVPETVVHSGTGASYRPDPIGDIEPSGILWTTDELTTDPRDVADLRARGVVGLDMETAAVAEVCGRRGVPWSVFRAVSDRATDGSVDDEVFRMSNQDGTPNPRAVAAYVARHPGRLPALARMARAATRATERATTAAVAAVTASLADDADPDDPRIAR